MRYTRAILRRPGANFADGVTMADEGMPDLDRALGQHDAYCKALEACGLTLSVLEADENFPDGCFVEDPAIVTEKMAIITRPGDASRLGEEGKIADVLSNYRSLEKIKSPGNVEGGDILRVGDHFYIGRSKRTNEEGARQLAVLFDRYGYSSSQIPLETVLHLKTGVTHIGKGYYISVPEFSGFFGEADVIVVSEEEAYAANCLPINDHLLIPKGYPLAKKQIVDLGFKVVEIEMSEFKKMDGGLTCLSLLLA